jgi:hypothetical protein
MNLIYPSTRPRTVMLLVSLVAMLAAAAPSGAGAASAKDFGFNDSMELSGLGTPLEASLTKVAGGNAARIPMNWSSLEPARDVWNEVVWTKYTLTYQTLTAAGITPYISISYSPRWARDAQYQGCTSGYDCNYPPAVSELDEWQEFIREVEKRFPKATIEVWNEPNYPGSWRSGPDPERYAQLLSAAYTAAHGANPNARVLAGGLGSTAKTGGMAVKTFLDRAYAAPDSIKGHMDGLNVHVYPTANLGPGSFFAKVMDDYRSTRAKYGDDATPLFVTETGASTTGGGAVSEADQASIVTSVVNKLMNAPDVAGVLVSRLLEDPAAGATTSERGLGLLRYSATAPLQPKPAFCALVATAGNSYAGCPTSSKGSGSQRRHHRHRHH